MWPGRPSSSPQVIWGIPRVVSRKATASMSRRVVMPGTAASRGVSWLSRNVTKSSGCGNSPSRRSDSASRLAGARPENDRGRCLVQWEVKDSVHARIDTVPTCAAPLKEAQVGGVHDPRLADGCGCAGWTAF